MKDTVAALEKIKDDPLPKLISGRIHNVEGVDNEVLIMMDQHSGIDYIRENEIGLQGIASRVQWGKAWDTFSIRTKRRTGAETEFEKRKKQIKHNYFYPFFTLQAYFDNRSDNNLLSVGIIKTTELYNIIENRPDLVHQTKSDNEFIFVRWRDLTGLVKTYHAAEADKLTLFAGVEQ